MDDTTFAYLVGTVGNLLFGFKSLPQVIQCAKKKSTDGLSPFMLICDCGGNIACAYFIFATTGVTLFPQYINYGFATLFLMILFIMMLTYDKQGNK